ncbi:uncoordinated protein 58 isoform X1 [Aphidius gifuensis]|uniref:uncoordinated protein 58 isoform X1 n=1 Tax=Aphidius gifuensis TaxID=684658 RepID=UPI001CDC8CE6|nr:uncoordinated protein 58 isoform X1 [Aphidius gifuensis]
MEDSYTVHRRRKSEAAKRRDKEASEAHRKSLELAVAVAVVDEKKNTNDCQTTTTDENNDKKISIKNKKSSDERKRSSSKTRSKDVNVSEAKLDMVKNRTDEKIESTKYSEKQSSNLSLLNLDESTNKHDDSTGHSIINKQIKKRHKSNKHEKKSLDLPKEYENNQEKILTSSGKKIIPLDNSNLMKDFQRIQKKEFFERRISNIIIDDEHDDGLSPDIFNKPKNKNNSRRSFQEDNSEIELNIIGNNESNISKNSKSKIWSLLDIFKFKKTPVIEENNVKAISEISKTSSINTNDEKNLNEKRKIVVIYKNIKKIRQEFKYFIDENQYEIDNIRKIRNLCIIEFILFIIYCGLGAFVFRFTEGAFETFYKCGVKRVKRDFLDNLWNYSHNMREDEWKSMARRKLMEFEEQLHTAHEAGLHSYSGQKSWTFLNAVVYCFSVITKIGYGHISPSTTTGRAITIVYAIFGIPMFLIILADFGKLFTRGMKFLWAFVRRLYLTGSCRRVRRRAQVQEVMKGVQLVYDFATFRRPSQMNPDELEQVRQQQAQTSLTVNTPLEPGTPATPTMSAFEIDDEFNLPISVAITILIVYIFVGAAAYNAWERWGFFESFYFVFISMSTIGFGDYVPKHPIYMMCSIGYLVFGLALTSMCINVVQVMLSDSFKQASQKIGATIGFEIVEENDTMKVNPTSELGDVHTTITEEDENHENPQEIPIKKSESNVSLNQEK